MNKTAKEIATAVSNGSLTAEQVAEETFAAIQARDGQLGAFLHLLEERTREKARAIDASGKKGKLAGVPIAVKDNIHIEGEISTCGSRFLTNYRAPFSATACRLLEDEGALLIGKTNCDEFAMGSSTENSALQKTVNPHDPTRVPGGSSGGSAAAVAANMCPVALGSDTGGSIRQPAAFCGVVGFKPTYGRVSRYGLVAFGSSLDQIGPLTNTVEDAALIMEVLGTHCPHDSTSLPDPAESYTAHLNTPIKGMKIGVPRSLIEQASEEAKEIFAQNLAQLGLETVDVDLSILEHGVSTYYIIAPAEASTNLARFDGIRYGVRSPKAETLNEVYDWSKEEGFGPEVKRRILLGTFVLSAGYQDAYYKKAQKVRRLMINQFSQIFQTCDLVALPTTTGPAFPLGAITDPLEMYLQDIFTLGANLAGLPAISVPAGTTAGDLPLGLQFMGPQKGDRTVLQVAHHFEQARRS